MPRTDQRTDQRPGRLSPDDNSDDTVPPGRSLLPLWDNPAQVIRRYAAAEMNYHVAYDPARSVYDGRYHFVRYYGDARVVAPNIGDSPVKDEMLAGGQEKPFSPLMVPPREGLFDLWFDPLQNNNLLDTAETDRPRGRYHRRGRARRRYTATWPAAARP